MKKQTKLFLILVLCLSFLTFSGCFSVENLIVVLSNYYHYGQPNRPEPKVSVEEYKQMAVERINQLKPEFYEAVLTTAERFAEFNRKLEKPLMGLAIRLDYTNEEMEVKYGSDRGQVQFDRITAEQLDPIIAGMRILQTNSLMFSEKPNSIAENPTRISYELPDAAADEDYNAILVFYYFNESDYPKIGGYMNELGNGWFLSAPLRTYP